MKPYDDFEYAHSRLKETIIRYNNMAVLVDRVTSDGFVVGSYLSTPKDVTDNIKYFNLDPVPLGYVNFSEVGTVYVVRMPMREDWRQGLRFNSMRSWNGETVNYLSYKSIANCIENSYPSLDEAIKIAAKQSSATAFHRDFAYRYDGSVFYKGKFNIGVMEKSKIKLNEKFSYLTDLLNEDVGIEHSF